MDGYVRYVVAFVRAQNTIYALSPWMAILCPCTFVIIDRAHARTGETGGMTRCENAFLIFVLSNLFRIRSLISRISASKIFFLFASRLFSLRETTRVFPSPSAFFAERHCSSPHRPSLQTIAWEARSVDLRGSKVCARAKVWPINGEIANLLVVAARFLIITVCELNCELSAVLISVLQFGGIKERLALAVWAECYKFMRNLHSWCKVYISRVVWTSRRL